MAKGLPSYLVSALSGVSKMLRELGLARGDDRAVGVKDDRPAARGPLVDRQYQRHRLESFRA